MSVLKRLTQGSQAREFGQSVGGLPLVTGNERTPPMLATRSPEFPTSDLFADAARAFVNRAGARLVCPSCWPECPIGANFAILAPAVNDSEEFREALRILGLDSLQLFPRADPLDWIPRCPGLAQQGGDGS